MISPELTFARAIARLLGSRDRLQHLTLLGLCWLSAFTAAGTGANTARAAPPRGEKSPAETAQADDESDADQNITGIERDAKAPGDAWRQAGDVALFLPRQVLDLAFGATGMMAGLMDDEQVVPRVRSLLRPRDGEIRVFPTALVETGTTFNVGARLLALTGPLAASARLGYGGPSNLVGESRLRLRLSKTLPTILSLQSFHDSRADLSFPGVGQEPSTDPRNQFVGSERSGVYQQRRERYIAGLGVRPLDDWEILLSTGYSHRTNRDVKRGTGPALDSVFTPGSLAGAGRTVRVVYGELAVRFDTRQVRGVPNEGSLLELYAGRATGPGSTIAEYYQLGGRAALFLPIVRATNTLSPKLVLDEMRPLGGSRVPFTLLQTQPDFRGAGTRADLASAVASLDYRWSFVRFISARLFFDLASVAPTISEVIDHGPRYAGGFGFDFFSRSAELGQIALATGPDGTRFLLSIGVGSSFGDRQHQ